MISKQTVPKERVRLRKDTVTDQETVSAQVRKEKIDVQGDGAFDKDGDRRETNGHDKSSGPEAGGSGAAAPRPNSAGGVGANATKAELLDIARELDVSGRSKMNKIELVEAINHANRNEPAAARRR